MVSHYFRSKDTTATIGLVIYLYNTSYLFVESFCINHYYMALPNLSTMHNESRKLEKSCVSFKCYVIAFKA